MGVSPRNYLPHIAESVRSVSLLVVSIVLFFDVSVSYRIYYMYHGFSVYMVNIRLSHLDIGPRLSLGPISRCSGLIFAIYPSKPWYIYYIHVHVKIIRLKLNIWLSGCCTTIKMLILQEPDNCISLHKNYNKLKSSHNSLHRRYYNIYVNLIIVSTSLKE